MPRWLQRRLQRRSSTSGDDYPSWSASTNRSSRNTFPSGIKLLYDVENSAVDVIFVHGLAEDSEKTWTAKNAAAPWPQNLLPYKVPSARVLTFGYDAYVADWRDVVSKNRIRDHAMNLLTVVATYRENDTTNDRPMIFVCHSLGGLVCKDALTAAEQQPERHLQKILHSTRGIIFLGTPHHGAGLAKWAEMLAKSIGLLKQANPQILTVLESDSEVLARVQDSFHTMIRSRNQDRLPLIEVACFFEELPLPGIGIVVPSQSAVLPGCIPIGIRSNHMDMTKFEQGDDPGFTAIVGELRRWIKGLTVPRNASVPGAARSQQVGQQHGAQLTIPPSNFAVAFSRAVRAENYTVGWICALPIEMAAATAMLDDRHEPFPRPSHGHNIYTFGRIGSHNVVLACLPAGVPGTTSAAVVATRMLSTFTAIKFSFMVGVGGGVPNPVSDIRLGDVVISKPSGTSGGVIQYDFGKTVQDGRFVQTGSLNKPPSVLLHAVASLETKCILEGVALRVHLAEMPLKFPHLRTAANYPGAEHDRLFEAWYDHQSDDRTCASCDTGRLVTRPARNGTEPTIHYGLIASGNQVMRHGVTRERLRGELDVLCFEMEAAGLMDDFPCLVIRGICDYADSHKNKEWQPYAAAAAAACAKELLLTIPATEVVETKTFRGVEEDEGTREVHASNTPPPFNSNVENLSTLFSELPDATDTFCGRTSELLHIAEALDPKSPGQKGMVLCGIGGSGKTQLALRYVTEYQQHYTAIIWINAFTTEHTIQSFDGVADMVSSNWPPRDVPLAYTGFSSWRKVISRLRSTRYTRWLLIIDSVDDLDQDKFRQYIPSCQYGSILVTSTQYRAPEVFRLSRLDVDPLPVNNGRELLLTRAFGSVLNADLSEDDCNVVTAIVNELHGMPLAIEQASALLKTVFSLSDFINAYRSHYTLIMKRYPPKGYLSYEKQRPIIVVFGMLYRSIENRSPEAAALLTLIAFLGPWQIPMSLMERFQLSTIKFHSSTDEGTKALIRVLGDLTTLRLALGDLADVCLLKLRRNYTLVCQSFSVHRAICDWCVRIAAPEKQEWIIQAAHRLATTILLPATGFPSAWEIERQSIIRSYLAPLDRCISLINDYIPEEYLSPPDGLFCVEFADIAAHLGQAYLCIHRSEEAIKYFSMAIDFERISQGDDWPSTETSLRLLQGLASACHKSHDLEKAADSLDSALTLSQRIYGQEDWRTAAISSRLKKVSERREVILEHHKAVVVAATDRNLSGKPLRRTELQEDTSTGVISGVFNSIDDQEQQYGESEPEIGVDCANELRGASYEGDAGMVLLLLGLPNIKINSKDKLGRTALLWAASQGHEAVVEQLLARNDVEADSKDKGGRTPLSWAASRGHEAVVRLLADRPDVDADLKDSGGRTPLSWAALYGHDAVVRLLADRLDVNTDLKDRHGQTRLLWAASCGQEAVVRLLADRPDVDADLKDNDGRTPLSRAASRGHEAVVRLLADRPDVNADLKDNDGRTPLSWAASRGHEAVVRLLADRPDVNADLKDNGGCTPLSWAASHGHEAVVRLLTDRPDINVDSKDSYGGTPLLWAASRGHKAVVRVLADRPDVDADLKDNNGRTPLLWAASCGHEAVVRLLADQPDVNVNSKDKNDRTPLLYAASRGHEAVVRLLADQPDVNVDSKDKDDRTPLLYAASRGHEAVVRLLADRPDVNKNSKDKNGLTPLWWAESHGYRSVVRLLADRPDVDADAANMTRLFSK